MSKEPENAKSEFFMAIAGPVSSVLIAGIFFLTYTAGKTVNWPEPVNGVLVYLGWLNIILAGFNMVPAFPLDGGRVLRSILWYAKGDLRWATRIQFHWRFVVLSHRNVRSRHFTDVIQAVTGKKCING